MKTSAWIAAIGLLTSAAAVAENQTGDQVFNERVYCAPENLNTTDEEDGYGFSIEINEAASDISKGSVRREYEFPDAAVRVIFHMQYIAPVDDKPARVEISKAFLKKNVEKTKKARGKKPEWALLPAFTSPDVLKLPMEPDASYIFNTSGASPIPNFKLECHLLQKRVKSDCENCK